MQFAYNPHSVTSSLWAFAVADAKKNLLSTLTIFAQVNILCNFASHPMKHALTQGCKPLYKIIAESNTLYKIIAESNTMSLLNNTDLNNTDTSN